ncbi:lim domain-containing protein plim2b [Anaeramoeba flamelloides]|uniref:Lim domain-containing protein plim2b n=1 Tax=Anaeramoeba flamelloides TaxID=1746091 RepID=A0AAV7ZFU0_9EUKA|nr:lim domain-containing protein plim2b [Anaeramoeba flamelloides]
MSYKCFACGKTVYQTEVLKILGREYHKRCFRCKVCNCVLTMKSYKALDGNPYCKAHYPNVSEHGAQMNYGQQEKKEEQQEYQEEQQEEYQEEQQQEYQEEQQQEEEYY